MHEVGVVVLARFSLLHSYPQQALVFAGIPAYGLDILNGFDLRDDAIVDAIIQNIAAGAVSAVWAPSRCRVYPSVAYVVRIMLMFINMCS